MSHTLHRRGTAENLRQDIIVFSMSAKGVNHVGSANQLREFLTIAYKHNPVNMGDMKTGNMLKIEPEEIIAKVQDTSIVHAVFTDAEEVAKVLAELREADLGTSIIVSGLFSEADKCVCMGQVDKHTVEHSLGIKGKTQKLPDRDVLQVSTMCGHGMVSAGAVLAAVRDIKRGRVNPAKAAREIAKPCECGVFNPARATRLLTDLAAVMTFDW